MAKIQLLDEDVINKIAAGEVVERPASIVKELLENSIDAGATNILVEIRKSGKNFIRISDNGLGMDKEDANHSIIRHATSKIRNSEDLFNINSLGFRGEALASIAAVSQMSIVTKVDGALEGYNLVCEGGLVVSSGPIASDVGTTIEVNNLFFNTPVRKKFLKTDAVELRHIIDIVTNYALLNPQIAIKLNHENHNLIQTPAIAAMRENVAAIYGYAIAKDLLEVDFERDGVEVSGLISKPYDVRNDTKQQVLFVNERWVKNSKLSKAIYDGYHSMLFTQKHPVFVLHIKIDPTRVDVNVHPQKHEIKIEQEELVLDVVCKAVNLTLENNNLIPVVDPSFDNDMMGVVSSKYVFDKSEQKTLEVSESDVSYGARGGVVGSSVVDALYDLPKVEEPGSTGGVFYGSEDVGLSDSDVSSGEVGVEEEVVDDSGRLPEMQIFGQIHKTFFLAQVEGAALVIDQHAAHERVMYEKFMKQYERSEVVKQRLLSSVIVDFALSQVGIVKENLREINQFGFELEHFGDNSFSLKTIPAIFGRLQPRETLMILIDEIETRGNKIDKIKEEIIMRMACRSAVMAGDELTVAWITRILSDLNKTKHPFTCPHGRPTMIKMTIDELEKKFRRK